MITVITVVRVRVLRIPHDQPWQGEADSNFNPNTGQKIEKRTSLQEMTKKDSPMRSQIGPCFLFLSPRNKNALCDSTALLVRVSHGDLKTEKPSGRILSNQVFLIYLRKGANLGSTPSARFEKKWKACSISPDGRSGRAVKARNSFRALDPRCRISRARPTSPAFFTKHWA